MHDVFVTDINCDNFFKFSELLDWDVHDLHLPVRVLASVYTYSRSPLLFSNSDNNEGVHFVE